MVNISKK